MPNELILNRVPESTNKSLRAWSAADELLVGFYNEKENKEALIYNDSFGYLTCHTSPNKSVVIADLKSQEKSILENLNTNKLDPSLVEFSSLLEKTNSNPSVGLMKIPKSLELFEMFLSHFSKNADSNGTLACGFMTRNFTKQYLEIANEYFENAEQSLSKKKARLLILSGIKKTEEKAFINTIPWEDGDMKQYFGVFSGKKIDFATQFLIENLEIPFHTENALDLASGNGILAKVVATKFPEAKIHLIDDSKLAIESSKLNLEGDNFFFYHNNNLENLNSNTMDFIVCNPPFHVEYEIDISLPLRLFRAVEKKLKPEGKFQLVANSHLNYKVHLEKIFKAVTVNYDNDKFVVYSCYKS